MIDLSNTKPFASGGNRDCYISPINSKACIKVTKKEILKKIKKGKVWYKKFRSNESFDDNLESS